MHNARSLVFLAAFVCALAGCLAPASPTTAQDTPGERPNLTIRQFMGELSNHGEWFTLDEWGWAWQPYDIEPWWVPYTHGEWQYTNQGPYWVSFKAYGWAVFHYGRWMLAEDRGWVWIPDTQWGPGFVCWRYGKGYLGWAPMPPEKPGDVGIATGECNVPAAGWSFILAHHAFYRNVEPYIVPRARSVNLLEVSTTKTDYQRDGMGWVDQSIPPQVMTELTGLKKPAREIELVTSPLQINASMGSGLPPQGNAGGIPTYAPVVTAKAQESDPPATPAKPTTPANQHPGNLAATNSDALRLAHERLMRYQHLANSRVRMMHDHDLQAPPWREFPPDQLPQWQARELEEQARQDASQRQWVDQRFLRPSQPEKETQEQ